jgi:hypothetical protein
MSIEDQNKKAELVRLHGENSAPSQSDQGVSESIKEEIEDIKSSTEPEPTKEELANAEAELAAVKELLRQNLLKEPAPVVEPETEKPYTRDHVQPIFGKTEVNTEPAGPVYNTDATVQGTKGGAASVTKDRRDGKAGGTILVHGAVVQRG